MGCPDSHHADEEDENRSSSKDNELELRAEHRATSDHPHPLDPLLFRRLNAELDREQGDASEHLRRLNELGALIRQWRLQRGMTRQALAYLLDLGMPQLTCLENAIAQPADISPRSLMALGSLAAEDRADSLATAVDSYLTDFCS